MLKTIFAAAVTLAALSGVARADDMMKCDDATMKMMSDDMAKIKDDKMMADTKKEMMAAADSMKAGKMDDCSMHMGMAKKAMMSK